MLMSKGYVIVFPNGTLSPTAAPTPGPRIPAQCMPTPQASDHDEEDADRTTYTWQRHRGIRQPTAQYPVNKRQKQTTDKLARLAKQLEIPDTSSFTPAPTVPGIHLRDKPHRALDTLNRLGDKILAVPGQLKDAYIRSGQSELNRLNEAAIEIFYRNQRKAEEKRRLQQEIQAQVLAHLTVNDPPSSKQDKSNRPFKNTK